MKKISIFFILILFVYSCSFATVSSIQYDPQPELSFSFLDTVTVYKCVKEPLYSKRGLKKNAKKEEIGKKVYLEFSNGLNYEYIRSYQEFTEEMRIKGIHHIQNVILGDSLVVRVLITPNSQAVTEVVENLSVK